MIIAIPTNENNMQTEICPSFGRAYYFLIYDTEKNKGDFLSNEAALSAGGAGIKAAQTVINQHAEAVLTPRLGQNSANVMTSAGIKIYKTRGENLVENINNFKSGHLNELEEIHAGFHRR